MADVAESPGPPLPRYARGVLVTYGLVGVVFLIAGLTTLPSPPFNGWTALCMLVNGGLQLTSAYARRRLPSEPTATWGRLREAMVDRAQELARWAKWPAFVGPALTFGSMVLTLGGVILFAVALFR